MNRTGNTPSEAMAETIKALVTSELYDAVEDAYRLPEGFVFCGAGAYRTCILAPDGYVYKVQHDTDSNWMENASEWEAYQDWELHVSDISNGAIRLARCVEYFTDSNVLVMEYEPQAANVVWYDIDEDDVWYEYHCCPKIAKALRLIEKETDIDDLHSGNVYFNTQGEIVIVDYESAA